MLLGKTPEPKPVGLTLGKVLKIKAGIEAN